MILTKLVSEFVSPWVRSKLCRYSLSAEFTQRVITALIRSFRGFGCPRNFFINLNWFTEKASCYDFLFFRERRALIFYWNFRGFLFFFLLSIRFLFLINIYGEIFILIIYMVKICNHNDRFSLSKLFDFIIFKFVHFVSRE